MLPIRIINSGAARALKHVTDQNLSVPPWIEAFAFDLDTARDAFTAHVRREVRPKVEALAKNRHFFAAEAIEAIFMQLFLLEVRKRTDIPSIIWLHDGLWIGSEVDDQVLFAAERHVRHLLFPHSDLTSSLFLITSLHDAWQAVASTCPPPLTLCCSPKIYKAPDEGCAGERLPGSCLLPNSATDKLQSVSCRGTSTEYTSGHAYATDKPMGHAVLVSCTVGYAFLPPTVFASKTLLVTPVYLSSLVGKLLGIHVSGGLLRNFKCYAAALLHQGL